MRMPTLETERLTIRPLKLSDLNACHQLLDIEDGGDGSLEERERWLRWAVLSEQQLAVLMQPPYGDRAMVVKNGGRMVGIAGLVPCILPLLGSLIRDQPTTSSAMLRRLACTTGSRPASETTVMRQRRRARWSSGRWPSCTWSE